MPMASVSSEAYFVPAPSRFPIHVGIALLFLLGGAAAWLNRAHSGPFLLAVGLVLLLLVVYGWFHDLAAEGPQFNGQVDQSIRWGMAWFIFSEVMLFAS